MSLILGILDSGGVAASTSSYESIASITPTAGTINILFSSIPSTYKHLQLRCIVRGNWSGGAGPYTSPAEITFNSDTGANYASHRLTGNGSTESASGNSSVNGITAVILAALLLAAHTAYRFRSPHGSTVSQRRLD